MVPGHEIVGKVIQIGSQVSKFKVGDTIGVGVFIDSCRKCASCNAGLEQYCVEGMTGTYNAYERDGKTIALGGYSNKFVIRCQITNTQTITRRISWICTCRRICNPQLTF